MSPARAVTRWGMAALGLAQLAGYLAFVPLFALLLPRRAVALAGAGAPQLLSTVLLAGAACASLANIVAGRWGDLWLRRHGSRRALVAAGMLGTALAITAMGHAGSPFALGLVTVAFQAMLNLLLAPLAASLPDHVPDRQKGQVAAILGLALPAAGLGTTLLSQAFPVDSPAAFAALGMIVLAGCLPLVLTWPLGPARPVEVSSARPSAPLPAPAARRLAGLWLARLLVQLGAAFVLNYFFLALANGRPVATASALTGRLALAATLCVICLLPVIGRWSDRHDRRRPAMIATGLATAAAIGTLGQVYHHDTLVMVAWAGFQIGLAGYLAIDAALVATLLGAHALRGQVLGVMNLAHTLPAVLVPAGIALGEALGVHLPWGLALSLAAGGPLGAVLVLALLPASTAQAW